MIKLTELNLQAGILTADDYKLWRQIQALYIIISDSNNSEIFEILKANYSFFQNIENLLVEISKFEMLNKEVSLPDKLHKDINNCLLIGNELINK